MIDLAEHAPSLFDWSDAELTRLTAEVAAADIAIFASPTYKAAYTGMLKAFLDRYGNNGLAGTVAVPVMTGGWPGHLLAVEVHLRPVLVELGADGPRPRPVRHRARVRRTWTPRWPGGPPPPVAADPPAVPRLTAGKPRSPACPQAGGWCQRGVAAAEEHQRAGRVWRWSRRGGPGRR